MTPFQANRVTIINLMNYYEGQALDGKCTMARYRQTKRRVIDHERGHCNGSGIRDDVRYFPTDGVL